MPTDERTKEQISAAIAMRLFPCLEGCWGIAHSHFVEHNFASDHNAALGLVVPAMAARGWSFTLSVDATEKTATALFVRRGIWHEVAESSSEIPRAICLAALAAMDAESKES